MAESNSNTNVASALVRVEDISTVLMPPCVGMSRELDIPLALACLISNMPLIYLFQAYLSHVTDLKYDPEDSIELWQTNTNIENWTYVELSIYTPYSFKLIFESQFEDDNEKGIILLDNLDVLYSSCESNQHSKMLHPPSEVANEEY
ncbi:unnamed protein product [Timema podura]|uniref:MAM domain-containing protein n=1 Tax=Timema podura TaxID=61482 RepID=A0ABN7PAS8_TIMPD|nr:unnamed protein product [Timema podura]